MTLGAIESKRLVNAIAAQGVSTSSGARMPATVRGVDADGTVWVSLAGSSMRTPARSTTVAVKPGDSVTVTIRDGRVSIDGNATTPATDDAKATAAMSTAYTATESARQALAGARNAQASAEEAKGSAARAHDAAEAATVDAAVAAEAAQAAQESADEARADAVRANTAANDALTQLSVVEDVAGTLSWISDHGSFTATSDTSVVEGRVYFELDGSDYVPVVEPTGNPSAQGWYVLDVSQSQSDYIMAHLAVTSAGLWILPSGMGSSQTPQGAPGYKLLLASNGTYVYDGSGHLVTTYGENIVFDSSRPQYIGGEDAYIAFYDSDDDGTPDSIRIGGDNVVVGSGRKLSEILDNVSTTVDIVSTAGTVFKSSTAATTLVIVVHHGADRIETQSQLAAAFGVGSRIQWSYMRTVDQTWQYISADDDRLSDGGFRFAISGDDVTGTLALQADVYVP